MVPRWYWPLPVWRGDGIERGWYGVAMVLMRCVGRVGYGVGLLAVSVC